MHDPYWNDVFETYTPDVELITDNGQKGTLYINQLENTITKYNFTDSKPIFLETGYGMLEFTDEVTQNGTNLSSDISITSNRIYVNSSGKPGFNVSAHLEFYSLGYESYPTVAFNDVNFYNCSIYPDLCTNVLYNSLYDGGTLEFDVAHWTTYSTNPYPALSVQLVYPLTAKNVEQNKFFTFTANITCNNGDCGNVTAYVDPQQQKPMNLIPITGLILIGIAFTLTGYLAFTRTRMPMANKLMVVAVLTFSFSLIFVMTGSITGFVTKDHISINPGDTPFYTNSSQPFDCGILYENQSCIASWTINATGPINTTYSFFVDAYATDAFEANSSKVNITIVEQTPYLCNNSIIEPGEDCDDGNTNNSDGCDENCHNETCGNGYLQTWISEECDLTDFGGKTCSDYGSFNAGNLICAENCTVNSSECYTTSGGGGGGGGHGGGGGVPVSLKPGCSSKECTKCADKNSCIAVGCEWDNTRCIFKTAAIPSVPAVTVPPTEVPEVPPTEEAPVSIFEEIPMWLIMLIIIIGLLAVALFLLLFFREGIIPEKQKIHEIRQKYPHHVKALDDYMVKARSKHYSKEHVEKLLIDKGKWNKNFVKSYLDMYYKK
jgi:cysteine-rich repeat protein